MKLGLQGVSVIYASGDSGVANRYNSGYPNSCLNEDQLFVDNNGTRYSPSFPVNCPYITAGKYFSTPCNVLDPGVLIIPCSGSDDSSRR